MIRQRLDRRWIFAGAAMVLAERLLTLRPHFATPLEASFGRALLGFNPFLHQPPPPGYPLFVGLGKVANFFLHDPLVSLFVVSIAGSVASFVFLARAFPSALGVALAFAASLTPLVARPLPDAAAMAFFAIALWVWRAGGNPILVGITVASAVACVPQAIIPILVFLLFTQRKAAVWAACTLTLFVEFLQTIQNIEVRRMQTFISANIDLRRMLDPPAVIAIAIVGLFAILSRGVSPHATDLARDPDVQRRGEH